MEGCSERVELFIAEMYRQEIVQPVEKILLSLNSISSLIEGGVKGDLISQIKRKLFEYKGMQITKEQMKKIIEIIVDAAKKNRVDMQAIDCTFNKENSPIYELDTSNTILLGDKGEETQYEFKSIIEDVNRGVESLEEKTKKGLSINLGAADVFITERKSDRCKRAEEFKMLQERKESVLKGLREEKPWTSSGVSFLRPENTTKIDRCSEILSKINGIINQKERPVPAAPPVKKLEAYETSFNQKMVFLLNELTERLKLSEQRRSAGTETGVGMGGGAEAWSKSPADTTVKGIDKLLSEVKHLQKDSASASITAGANNHPMGILTTEDLLNTGHAKSVSSTSVSSHPSLSDSQETLSTLLRTGVYFSTGIMVGFTLSLFVSGAAGPY
ncbi:hypothetical protein NECID01_0265 [Nematocida sp. AWRm77]|nr:hypothetical protein NECID01_0265 [Nematocida sp. AWRm77]